MRAASLLLVFVVAKAAVLAGHTIPLSWWSPIAYLWQDAFVVLVFAVVEAAAASRKGVAWAAYAVVAAYVAVNVPVTRVLSTPLTWPMLRAARGALGDSIWYYVDGSHVLLVMSVLVVAALAPRLFSHVPQWPLVAALALLVALGPAATARVDTIGLERNAWTALVQLKPHVETSVGWQITGFDHTPHEDLSGWRGAAAHKNIVLVSLESTASQYLGIYGAHPDVTPNLSELARSAVVFENAYAVYPESIKGLFSILCSAYPAFESRAEAYASAPCRSMAAILSQSGYRTALFHSGRFDYLGMEAVIRNRGFDTLADAGDIGGNRHSSFGIDEPSAVARILQWIDALPVGQRFFVTYLPIAGHHPYETPAPGPFSEQDEFGRYRNALHYGDESVGALMHGLRARGLERSTIWIVLGDHGEAFGQHEGNYGHTFFLYDENVRVPFLVAAPGTMPRQTRSRQVVSLIDAAPTILDLASLPAPGTYQGQSILAVEPRMALFFADYSLSLMGLRDGPLKFIHEVNSGRSKLFDIDHDPLETIDRSAQYPERARWYLENLQNWSAAQQKPFRASLPQ